MKNKIIIFMVAVLSGCANINTINQFKFIPLNDINENNSITCTPSSANSINPKIDEMYNKYVSKYYLTKSDDNKIQVTMLLFGKKNSMGLFSYYGFFGIGNDYDHADYKDLFSKDTTLTIFKDGKYIIIYKDMGSTNEVRISAECSINNS